MAELCGTDYMNGFLIFYMQNSWLLKKMNYDYADCACPHASGSS